MFYNLQNFLIQEQHHLYTNKFRFIQRKGHFSSSSKKFSVITCNVGDKKISCNKSLQHPWSKRNVWKRNVGSARHIITPKEVTNHFCILILKFGLLWVLMEASFNKLKLIQASKRRFHFSYIKVFGRGIEPWLSVKLVYAIHCLHFIRSVHWPPNW